MADWVKTCHFLRLSRVSQISYNCTVTHHPDTHPVRETGLMIQIPPQSMGDRAWIIWCFLEKRHSLCYFWKDGRLAWQKCHGSYLCRDIYLFQPVCGASWHQLIISSELRREQSSCVSMSRTSIYLLIQVIYYNCHYFLVSCFIQSFSFSLSVCWAFSLSCSRGSHWVALFVLSVLQLHRNLMTLLWCLFVSNPK